MIEIRYVLFHFILVVVLFLYCRKISAAPIEKYWKYAIPPILLFTFEEGLRWGREIDWCVYYGVYENLKHGVFQGHEPLFTAIWLLFAKLNLEYYILIAFCSFLLIYSIFFFFKPYKEINRYAIPFAVLMVAGGATNLIRWFMGGSFLLIALRFYLDGKRGKALIFSIAACCTHIGLIVAIPLLCFSLLKKKEIVKPRTAILISILLSVFFDRSILGEFSFIFDWFNFYSRFAHYSDSASDWLTGDASKILSARDSAATLLFVSVPLWFFIYYSHKFIQNKEELIPLWNTLVLGVFLRNIARGLELLGRYAGIFDILFCVAASYGILYLVKKRNKTLLDLMGLLIMVVFIVKKIYVFCFSAYDVPELMQYVWDMQTNPSTLIHYYYMK